VKTTTLEIVCLISITKDQHYKISRFIEPEIGGEKINSPSIIYAKETSSEIHFFLMNGRSSSPQFLCHNIYIHHC